MATIEILEARQITQTAQYALNCSPKPCGCSAIISKRSVVGVQIPQLIVAFHFKNLAVLELSYKF